MVVPSCGSAQFNLPVELPRWSPYSLVEVCLTQGLPLLHCDMYLTGGPQCQVMHWIWFDSLARNQGKAHALGEGGEQEMTLHHGKVQAEADARACTERHVRITGKLFLPFRREALRIKVRNYSGLLTTFGGSQEVFCCGLCSRRLQSPQQKRREPP